jgi:hypothetical protein
MHGGKVFVSHILHCIEVDITLPICILRADCKLSKLCVSINKSDTICVHRPPPPRLLGEEDPIYRIFMFEAHMNHVLDK